MKPSSTSAVDLHGCRELQFLSREESLFPHLLRLSLDFNFRVLECLGRTPEAAKQYLLAADDFTSGTETITPVFPSLKELNQYVGEHMIDILHDYLFGAAEEDTEQQQTYA